MPKTLNDPLLALARGLIWVLFVVVGLIALAFAIGLPLALIMPETLFSSMLGPMVTSIPPGATSMLAATFGLALLTLLAARYFLKQLFDIVGSVAAGDPFVPVNADRLTRMAWAALGIQVLEVPLTLIQFRLQNLFDLDDQVFAISFPDHGLVLALVLFILARVFRHGTTLREELEGTV